MEEQMQKKKSPSKIIIIILLVIIVGLGGFIFINRDALFSKNDNSKAKAEETEKAEKEDSSEKITLDISKCANCDKDWKFTSVSLASGEINDLSVKVENGQAKVTVDWDKYCKTNTDPNCQSGSKTYDVVGLKDKVKYASIGSNGQDATGTAFYFVLENGTVEYTKLYSSHNAIDESGNEYTDWKINISNNHFASQGAIKGIKDIVKIYTVGITSGYIGFVATIGETSNGTLYNLNGILYD